jgi:hypothetical protein
MTFTESYEPKKKRKRISLKKKVEVNTVEHPYFSQPADPEVIALHGAPLSLEALKKCNRVNLFGVTLEF